MQPIRKIYVNSSHRVSGTPASFRYELPIDVNVGAKAHLAITSISLPHTFYGVQAGLNNRLFVREVHPSNSALSVNRILELDSGDYSSSALANAISQKINSGALSGVSYVVSYSSVTLRLTVTQTGGGGVRVYADQDLKGLGPIGEAPIVSPQSLNAILNTPSFVAYNVSWVSGIVSIAQITEVFIRSPELAAGYSTLDPGGEMDCLRRVHIDRLFGEIVTTDHSCFSADLHDVSGRTIRSFSVQLTDSYGSLVQLDNIDWSFSISMVYGDFE